VCELLNDAERARAMGEAAQERVKNDFLRSRHLAQYVEICAQLI
jgi:hypothetical protein